MKSIKLNRINFVVVLITMLMQSISINAQQPPLPSVETAFSKIKNNDKVYKRLKETYKIAAPKECKIEAKEMGVEGMIPSTFRLYKSAEAKRLNWYWPEDRASIIFFVTTPESEEGVKYILPIEVEYTRLVSGVLRSEWHYKWWKFNTPYSVSGGKEDELFMQLFLQKMGTLEGDVRPYKRNDMPTFIQGMTKIDTIYKAKKQDKREYYSNADFVKRIYLVKGESIQYNDRQEASVKGNFKNSIAPIQATFRRDKDENGKAGDWFAEDVLARASSTEGEAGTITGDKTPYRTVGSHGFSAIYTSTEKIKTPIPYFSDINKKDYLSAIPKLVEDLYFEKEGAEEGLKKFIVPGDDKIIPAFKTIFEEMKAKKVKLKKVDYGKDYYVKGSANFVEDVEKCYLSLYLSLKRPGINVDKALKKEYKNAGMSKEVMATHYGEFWASESLNMKFILVDGVLKLISVPKLKKPITF